MTSRPYSHLCHVEGCAKRGSSDGLCPMHYRRVKRYGVVEPELKTRGKKNLSPETHAEILRCWSRFETQMSIAKKFDIDTSTVSYIIAKSRGGAQ